jgi:hypothetical protein
MRTGVVAPIPASSALVYGGTGVCNMRKEVEAVTPVLSSADHSGVRSDVGELEHAACSAGRRACAACRGRSRWLQGRSRRFGTVPVAHGRANTSSGRGDGSSPEWEGGAGGTPWWSWERGAAVGVEKSREK